MSDLHVSDGKISGGDGGAKVCGIIILIFMNIFYFVAYYTLPIGLKIIHLVLSFANIPVAKIGQRIGKAIDEAVHGAAGENTGSVYVSRRFTDIIMRKYLGDLVACAVLEGIMFLVFNGMYEYY